MIDEHNSLDNSNLNLDSSSNDKKSHKILWASIGVVVLIIAGGIGYYKISHPNIISDQKNIDTTRAVFASQETCESQTGFPCRLQMCAEDGTGICDNFKKGWSAVSSLYTVEEVLRNDRLKYRGASSEVTSPYLIRAYLVSRKTVDCPPCLSPDPSVCAPCPLGQIILAPASNPKSADTLMVGVIPGSEINNAIQKLELNTIYEFTLKPGQNYPELVSVALGYKSTLSPSNGEALILNGIITNTDSQKVPGEITAFEFRSSDGRNLILNIEKARLIDENGKEITYDKFRVGDSVTVTTQREDIFLSSDFLKPSEIKIKQSQNPSKSETGDIKNHICKLKPFSCEVYSFTPVSCNIKGYETLYAVQPNCTDVPSVYYNEKFEEVASCGGMPLPNGGTYKSSNLCDEIPRQCATGPAPTVCSNF